MEFVSGQLVIKWSNILANSARGIVLPLQDSVVVHILLSLILVHLWTDHPAETALRPKMVKMKKVKMKPTLLWLNLQFSSQNLQVTNRSQTDKSTRSTGHRSAIMRTNFERKYKELILLKYELSIINFFCFSNYIRCTWLVYTATKVLVIQDHPNSRTVVAVLTMKLCRIFRTQDNISLPSCTSSSRWTKCLLHRTRTSTLCAWSNKSTKGTTWLRHRSNKISFLSLNVFIFWLISGTGPYLTPGVGAPIPVPGFLRDVPGPKEK